MKTDAEFDGVSQIVRHITFADPDYFWGEGTGFFVLHDQSFYFVTAKHNILKEGRLHADSLMVTAYRSRTTIPFDRMLLADKTGADVDQQDFVIFHVDPVKATNLGIDVIHAIQTKGEAMLGSEVADGTLLRCAGYPTADDPYDWENRTKSVHLLVKEGRKNGSALGEGFGTFQGDASLRNFSGMSGSPVFALVNEAWLWVGMAVRASGKSGIINYINTDLILDVLRRDAFFRGVWEV
ncbi:serine protease [Pseudomonas lurida]|uniref:serine protease n=1 Tax=Pseudomonas lurida TaxID=244566 RepID=UPI001F18D857|nr:serine protease [Pseudomonas lurida]MCF5025131.1 hypothetical protein [Pseudomonas lurida]MCF5308308.1 hypothetical protein [Pseudomonas lurida]MCF5327418.1 hypothetical protein [Pseudomonas lurida]